MRLVAACMAAVCTLSGVLVAQSRVENDRAIETSVAGDGRSFSSATSEAQALAEMIGGRDGRPRRWRQAPELVVLMPVMQFHATPQQQYVTTGESLTTEEAEGLVTDLSASLALLTGNAFRAFSAVRFERASVGTTLQVMRPGQIVAGRFRDVRRLIDAVGYGGRSTRADGTIVGGAILLDEEYDRASSKRSLTRTHELGHALGYDHVTSRPSIMNPRIGSEATELDRRAAMLAFRAATVDSASQ